MKKRILRILLIAGLAISQTGCGGLIGRTLNGAMQLPNAVLRSATNTVGGIGG